MTPAQARALTVLYDLTTRWGWTTPRAFAAAMWPDSPAWKRRTNPHDGLRSGAMGGTMPMLGARMLWTLQGKGWATVSPVSNRWEITESGKAALENL